MGVKISVADIRIGWTPEQEAAGSGPAFVRLVSRPQNFYSLGPADSVGAVFDGILKDIGSEKIEVLSIFGHGYVEKDAKNEMHGGFGMQFGKDDILVNNADALFRRFNGRFAGGTYGIELVGCRVAEQSRVKTSKGLQVGDGLKLCEIIARAANTNVRASPASQVFTTVSEFSRIVNDPSAPLGRASRQGEEVDPGAWEGNTWVIGPKGKL